MQEGEARHKAMAEYDRESEEMLKPLRTSIPTNAPTKSLLALLGISKPRATTKHHQQSAKLTRAEMLSILGDQRGDRETGDDGGGGDRTRDLSLRCVQNCITDTTVAKADNHPDGNAIGEPKSQHSALSVGNEKIPMATRRF
jgi:hypothetical protein